MGVAVKRIILSSFALMIATLPYAACAQEFVIGAEWLNYVQIPPYPVPSNDAWWQQLDDLGLNWGMFEINEDDDDFDAFLARAHSNVPSMKFSVERRGNYSLGACPTGHDDPVFYFGFSVEGARHVYQAEYAAHYLDHPTGIGTYVSELSYDVDDTNHDLRNCWYADPEYSQPGYMLRSLVEQQGILAGYRDSSVRQRCAFSVLTNSRRTR
jgi:hypothetical protein